MGSVPIFVAGGVALVAYLLTVAPTVTGEDSGELIAAAWTLGIPHPPGYPFWCLVARAFMLLPVGDVAFRANLASAVCGALAVGVFVAIAMRMGVRPLLAGACGVLLAASATLWGQAVIAEVYTLSALTLFGVLYALLAWRDTADARWLYGGAFLAGVSSGAHPTVALLVPVVAIFLPTAAWTMPPLRHGWGWRRGLGIAAALLGGGSVFAYLPLRAAAHPAMNWGNPDNWDRFWAHVLRLQYAGATEAHAGPGHLGEQLAALLGFFGRQWPLPVPIAVALFAAGGAVWLARRQRATAVLLLAALAMLSVAYVPILDFSLDSEGLHVAEVFFIPAWTCVLLLAAVALERLAGAFRYGPGAVVAGVLLASALSFVVNAPSATMHGNTMARHYGADLLATLPHGALLFTSADYEAFPVAYLQIVEGQRTDVVALDEQRDVARALRMIGADPAAVSDPMAVLAAQTAHPVYATRRQPTEGAVFRPVGLLLRAWPTGQGEAAARALDEAAWQGYAPLPDGPWIRGDWSTASMAAAYEQARARSALAHGSVEEARRHAAASAALLPADAVHANSLGALLAIGGDYAGSLEFYRKAVDLRGGYVEARFNLITTLMQLGDWDAAQAEYARARNDGVALGAAGERIEQLLMQRGSSR